MKTAKEIGELLLASAAASSDLVLVLSREGVVHWANAASMAALPGGGPLEGHCLVDVVDVLSRDPLEAALWRASGGETTRVEVLVADPPVALDFIASPASDTGQDVVLVGRRTALSLDIAQRLADLNRRYLEKVRELAALTGRLREAAVTDPLTNLFNRRAFLDRAEAEWIRAHRHGQPLAVVVLDLDHFKTVNDRHGHAAGDDVLRYFAMLLRTTVRASDIPARLGGEEFVAMLPHTDAEGAMLLAERIRTRLSDQQLQVGGGELVHVTCSAGIACAEPETAAFAELLGLADAALYAAKSAGRDCVRLAPPRRSSAA